MKLSKQEMKLKIDELELRLEESEQLVEAIKAGEVDAFAINNDNESEIYTLQSGDYAYRILIEKFGEGALNVTEDGLIVYTNSAFCELIKTPYDQVIGSHITKFIHKDYLELFKSFFNRSLTESNKGEINLIADGKIIPASLSFSSLQPKLATVGIIVTDYTHKKNTEGIILEYQKNLELTNKQLKANNEELASFVYIASHDLQEPLRKIQMFASRLQDNDLEALSTNGFQFFEKMQLEAHRMQTLIRDLLDYSRTNKPELTYVNSDLKNVFKEVMEEMDEALDESNAVIEIQKMCNVDIIHFQFKQLLNNLISNAIKFAKPNNVPHMKISSKIVKGNSIECPKLSKKMDYCHLQFSDKGIGFNQHYSEKIFEVFQRLHGKSQYKGTGVGLAIVKKIVDNHDGIITATSSANKGAKFDIFIPVRRYS